MFQISTLCYSYNEIIGTLSCQVQWLKRRLALKERARVTLAYQCGHQMADLFPWQQPISYASKLKIDLIVLNGRIFTFKGKSWNLFSLIPVAIKVFGTVVLEIMDKSLVILSSFLQMHL